MFSGKKGNVLLYLVMGMSMLTALGLGIFYVSTTSTFSEIGANNLNKAHYLAESGIRYALKGLRDRTLTNTSANGTQYNFNSTTKGNFILRVSGIGSNRDILIESTGVSNPNTPSEARKTIILTIPAAQAREMEKPPFSSAGEEGRGIAALAEPAAGASVSGVTVDASNRQIDLGFNQSTGSCIPNTAGCVWYQGWADSNGSACMEGRCNFNKGIRAYFDFQYNIPWRADGFTFSIISAHNIGTDDINHVTDCGGGSCGEYMGYAGPGLTGIGIQPPKIAIEFDPYISGANTVCSSFTNRAQCGSRNDNTFAAKHAAFIYWGTNSTLCSSPVSNTYDDNRHGEGDGVNDPRNPDGGDINPNGTYPYAIRDFDSFGTLIGSTRNLSFRLEIDRIDDSTSVDYRKYKMRAWLKVYNVNGYQDSNGVKFDDTSTKYNKNNDDPPSFQQTITMTQVWHDKFDRMLFGWTQGTGGSCQVVVLQNFKIDFKNINDF